MFYYLKNNEKQDSWVIVAIILIIYFQHCAPKIRIFLLA